MVCSIPQKINFVKFILQKNLIFAKFDPLSFFQSENRACNSVTESAHPVPLVLKVIVSLLKTANPDGDERIWTADLLVANQMLSQLSYTPKRQYVVYYKKW